MTDRIVNIDRFEEIAGAFGNLDENIQLIEKEFSVQVNFRNGELKVTGDTANAEFAARTLEHIFLLASKGTQYKDINVDYIAGLIKEGNESALSKLAADSICMTAKGKPIKAKTIGQHKYIDAIAKNTITFGVGPAGTGKTYLAVAMAVAAFREKSINRIVVTRPAVEAGEKLGFLPGDLATKVDPYLRPLHDALFDMLGVETYQRYLERGNIEVAPLAYMRGRTLDDSFIILDEAQNTTPEQMKMFLTRLGFNSKVVVTGDITQVDLPAGKRSGLVDAIKIVKNIEDIEICMLTDRDVVRHKLVQRIVKAYEKHEEDKADRLKKYEKNRYYFANDQKAAPVDAALKALVKKVCDKTLLDEEFGCPAEISITFTDNLGIKEINEAERGIDKETDVLSFPLIGEDESPDILPDGFAPLGDIVLSLEKATVQAEEYGHSYEREVAFLCVHSVLHLLGYDHLKENEEQQMIVKQEKILTSLGITRNREKE